ncbi:hypothetical protein ACFCP7_28770, partial [Paenibacillus elgii]
RKRVPLSDYMKSRKLKQFISMIWTASFLFFTLGMGHVNAETIIGTTLSLQQERIDTNIYDSSGRLQSLIFSRYGKRLIQNFTYDQNGNTTARNVDWYKESFESGSYDATIFNSGYPDKAGSITNDPQKVISGKYSAIGTASATVDWSEFLHTDPNKFQFEPNTTYTVTFKYKVNALPSANGHFYFLARAAYQDFSHDKGWEYWTDPVGTVGTKTITFTTDAYANYYLIWGLHFGGSLSIDDVQFTKVS